MRGTCTARHCGVHVKAEGKVQYRNSEIAGNWLAELLQHKSIDRYIVRRSDGFDAENASPISSH